MKIFVLSLFVLLNIISFSAAAQHPGYVISHDGDSISGNISYKRNQFFVENAAGKLDSVSTKNIARVNYKKHSGRVYYGSLYQFDNDINPVREKADDKRIDTTLILKTVFANDKMTLLEGIDHYKRIYYFVEKKGDSIPTQMMVSYRIITVTNASVAILNANVKHIQIKTYIAQLKNMMADCKYIDEYHWDNMDYRSYSFKSVIKWYTKNCK
jgi:hypothetical protein